MTAIRVESLTPIEVRTLIDQAYSDGLYEVYSYDPLDDPTIHKVGQLATEAHEFCKAWMNYAGNGVSSMLWALNNEALPYRSHLIPLLVGMRLHDTP